MKALTWWQRFYFSLPWIKKRLKKQLDFEHRCCFFHQVRNIGSGLKDIYGEVIEVPMKSGNVGLYRVTSEQFNYCGDNTGQNNYFFQFLGYTEDDALMRKEG